MHLLGVGRDFIFLLNGDSGVYFCPTQTTQGIPFGRLLRETPPRFRPRLAGLTADEWCPWVPNGLGFLVDGKPKGPRI